MFSYLNWITDVKINVLYCVNKRICGRKYRSECLFKILEYFSNNTDCATHKAQYAPSSNKNSKFHRTK